MHFGPVSQWLQLVADSSIKERFGLDRGKVNECIDNGKGGCLVTLRFWDVVGGLASSLHPLLGFDQSPRLDTGGVRNASAGKIKH